MISCVALGLIIHTKRQVSDTIEPGKPAQPTGRRVSDSTLNQAASNRRSASLDSEDAPPLPKKIQPGGANMSIMETEA